MTSFSTFPGRGGAPSIDDKVGNLIDDVTCRSRRDRLLRRDVAQMAAIFDQAQVGLSKPSLNGGFPRVNNELCRMLGRSRETLLTLGVPDVTHPDDVAKSLTAVGALIEDGMPVTLDKRYRRPDGSIVWASSSISRLDPPVPGAPCSLLAVTLDMIERTLAENMIDNALRDRPPDGPIRVHVDSLHQRMILTVHNDGAAIAPDRLESVFQVYRRALASRDAGSDRSAAEVGMCDVRSVAESHGGSVGIESLTGRGTTWIIDLPIDSRPYRNAPTMGTDRY